MSSRLLHRPLFHPKTLTRAIDAWTQPTDFDARHRAAMAWAEALRTGKFAKEKETTLQGHFLERVFADALGWPGPTQAVDGVWNLKAEKTLGAGNRSADGALGWFGTESSHVLAPVELKKPAQHLDLSQGRELTPVQQAWDYANHTPESRWIVLSNFDEIRLYSTLRTPDDYEVLSLRELADEHSFRRFSFLFSRATMLPASPAERAPLDDLLVQSEHAQVEITNKLYQEYAGLRRLLFDDLKVRHPNLPPLELLEHAQTLLDRVLFIAFAEDRKLLPDNTLAEALQYRNKYEPRPVWHNLRAVFRWIDEGNPANGFPRYNGGLFEANPQIDLLEVSDATAAKIMALGEYDFAEDVSVEVLGHIFEQSITDIEEMRAEAAGAPTTERPNKRHAHGIYYTPPFVTRFIVRETLGAEMRDRFDAAAAGHGEGTTKADWIAIWTAYRDALKTLHVLDPACGSGAFLLAAYDALAREYERVNQTLASLRGDSITQFGIEDLSTTILNRNLFGVDLNAESTEITKLSLWLRTARRNQLLTYLERNVKRGNSVVDDTNVDPWAFDWATGTQVRDFLAPADTDAAREIDARWRERFDVVIGNPPYVRQEILGDANKKHWSERFQAYDGMADLYVYFFERALDVLKPGGRMGFIVSNKWLKAGYADKLRPLLARKAHIERMVDFGHAPIFEDADTFPVIIIVRKVAPTETDAVSMTRFPREELKTRTIEEYVAEHAYAVPQASLGKGEWTLEPPAVEALMEKIRRAGVPLAEYAGCAPLYGIKTGCNEAFLIDTPTRDRLVAEDPRSAGILKKYLRGQDISRWAPEWDGVWMVYAPWDFTVESFPAIQRHLLSHRVALENRAEVRQDRFPWFALSRYASEYVGEFDKPKIVYQVIQFHPGYSLDDDGLFLNDKAFAIPTADSWLLAVLNSPLMWWHNTRYLPHMKDEALTPLGEKVVLLPIARPSTATLDLSNQLVPRAIAMTREIQGTTHAALDALRMQFAVGTPGQKLSDLGSLDSDGFVTEVIRRRTGPKLSAAAQKELRALYTESAIPIQTRRGELLMIERQLDALVNEAYGLTPDDVHLLWDTAPPRMPFAREVVGPPPVPSLPPSTPRRRRSKT